MRRSLLSASHPRQFTTSLHSFKAEDLPIVRIEKGTFYRKYPSAAERDGPTNRPIFPCLDFSFPSSASEQQHWAIIGPSNAGKTTLLEILRGQHLCLPPTARSFPYLSSRQVQSRHRNPLRAIQYVGFDGERGGIGKSGTRGAYLSARYESRREGTDFSVQDFLRGNTDLNPAEEQIDKEVDNHGLREVIADLRLEALKDMPMGNLSNGQTRRARIARALLGKPMVLLLDEPFMGLDPPTIKTLTPLLYNLAKSNSPRIMLALRRQDPLPDWITHLIHLGPNFQVLYQGSKNYVPPQIQPERQDGVQCLRSDDSDTISRKSQLRDALSPPSITSGQDSMSREGLPLDDREISVQKGEPLVEMHNVRVKYGEKVVLGGWGDQSHVDVQSGLEWTVRRGERWGVFGPNGSGKTTLLSLICSDHPQAYSLPIKIFGRSRLPKLGQPGIAIFDIQARIGQSSPEIHAFFPRNLSIRQTVQNAWADTFLGTPRLTRENEMAVNSCLCWFEPELNPGSGLGREVPLENSPYKLTKEREAPSGAKWADELRFGDAPFSAQRVALFLRAIVKKPDLVVLDEAFSGMDERTRDKCMLFLTWGETRSFGNASFGDERKHIIKTTDVMSLARKPVLEGLSKDQALICVSHVKEEVPGLVGEWLSLPEASSGKTPKFGSFDRPLEAIDKGWDNIWNV